MGAALVLLLVGLGAMAAGVLIGRYYVPDDRQLRRTARHSRAYMRALSHLVGRDHETAINELRTVVEENVDDVEPYFALGAMFRSRGEHERAIRVHQALALREHNKRKLRQRAMYELGLDFRAAGMPRRATRAMEEVVLEEPDHEGALRVLAALYEEQARFNEAAGLWQRLGRRRGEDTSDREHHLLVAAAQAAIGRGDLDAAKPLLKSAQKHEESSHFFAAAAELAAARGNPGGAKERLKQALMADPALVPHLLPALIAAEQGLAAHDAPPRGRADDLDDDAGSVEEANEAAEAAAAHDALQLAAASPPALSAAPPQLALPARAHVASTLLPDELDEHARLSVDASRTPSIADGLSPVPDHLTSTGSPPTVSSSPSTGSPSSSTGSASTVSRSPLSSTGSPLSSTGSPSSSTGSPSSSTRSPSLSTGGRPSSTGGTPSAAGAMWVPKAGGLAAPGAGGVTEHAMTQGSSEVEGAQPSGAELASFSHELMGAMRPPGEGAPGDVALVPAHRAGATVIERVLGVLAEVEAQRGPRLELALIRAQLVPAGDRAAQAALAKQLVTQFPAALAARVATARLAIASGDPAAIREALDALVSDRGALAWTLRGRWQCAHCGHRPGPFSWRCGQCRRWNTLRMETGIEPAPLPPRERRAAPRVVRPDALLGAARDEALPAPTLDGGLSDAELATPGVRRSLLGRMGGWVAGAWRGRGAPS